MDRVEAGDELDEDAVRAALDTAWLGRPYYYAASVGSTNQRLKAWAAEPELPHGAVLLAEHQTAGRGRFDRRWEAPPGAALLFSTLLRPGWPAQRGAWLTMLGGLAVAEAIASVTGLTARLKWPNDVMIDYGGAWRKVCGLLLDATIHGDRLESAILGIGLNVNIAAEALPDAATSATSLRVAVGRPVARRPLLVVLLAQLERRYDAAAGGHSPWAEWNERLISVGQPVRVTAAGEGEPFDGVAEGTDEWGQLLVRDAAGRLRAVAAGDVTLRGH